MKELKRKDEGRPYDLPPQAPELLGAGERARSAGARQCFKTLEAPFGSAPLNVRSGAT